MDFTPLNVTFAILGISLLVVVHEAGHYFAARAFGMRVLKFSIGLGKPIWKYQPKGSPTTFQVCMVPLLAYVQIDGMNPADDVDPKDPALYPNKGVFGRIVTIFAGPFANYLAASLMLLILAQVGGIPEPFRTNRVATVMKATPAQLAKVRTGDEIVEVNGTAVEDYQSLIAATAERANLATEYVVIRDGERITLELTPAERELPNGQTQAIIGVQLASERVYNTHSFDEATEIAIKLPFAITLANLEGIANLIQRPDPSQVKSVVGMTKMLSDSIRVAPQQYVWYLIIISVALGLFNLLPVPALDGGRLAFLAYEVITRRRANERVETAVHTVGLLFLLGVIALVMVRDVIDLT